MEALAEMPAEASMEKTNKPPDSAIVTELFNMNLSEKDSRLACAIHVLRQR